MEVFGVRTYMQITDVNVGILFVLAISAVSVYGVALGRLVVQQQVLADWRPAQQCADDQL